MSHELENYCARVRVLSHRLVNAQAPLRLLDAIRWDDDIRRHFFAANCKRQPRVDADYYHRNAIAFDPAAKTAEFRAIADDAVHTLGSGDPLASWLVRLCDQYRLLVELIAARGSRSFGAISRELYGAASDRLPATSATRITTATLAMQLLPIVRGAIGHYQSVADRKRHSAKDAAAELQHRLTGVFGSKRVRLLVSDRLIADAAAGPDYIKLRAAAKYSDRDIGVLEVHEGWVHIGTSFNGQAQPCCTFLGKTAPAASSTQEGLAVLTEIVAGKSCPARVYKLLQRAVAIHLVEAGASFIDVFRYFTDLGDSADSVYQLCMRVFRGSTPTGAAFTKDVGYLRGLAQLVAFVRTCFAGDNPARLALLFCGKFALDEIAVLEQLAQEGVITAGDFVAPAFADHTALGQSMATLAIAPALELAALL